VYFEVGYAIAQDKNCLIITDDPQIASFFDGPADVLLISDMSSLITLTICKALTQILAGDVPV